MKSLKLLVLISALIFILSGCGVNPGEIKLNTGSVTLKTAGATSKLVASVFDTSGNTISDLKAPIEWKTTNADVATVDLNGAVKAIGSGTANVTATIGALTTSAVIKVQIVSKVIVTPGSVTLSEVGATQIFKATVKDEKGNTLANVPVTWKVGKAGVIKSMGKGTIKALAKGKTIVKAIAGDKVGTSSVTVILPEKDEDSKAKGFKKKTEKKKAVGFKKKKK